MSKVSSRQRGAFFGGIKSVYPYMFTSMLMLGAPTLHAADAGGEPGDGLTLRQAVRMALEQNRDLRIAETRREQARANAEAATGRLMPRVDATWNASRTDSPLNAFGTKLLQQRITAADFAIANLNNPAAINNYRTGVAVSLPVWQGGALWAGKRAGEAGADAADWQYASARQQTVLRVIEAFARLKAARAERRAAEQAVAAARDHLEDTRALKKRGLAIASDVMDARSHWLEARVNLQAAQHAEDAARDEMRRLLGLPAGSPVRAGGESRLSLPERGLEAWLKLAEEGQPAIKAARKALEAAKAKADAARAPFLPSVALMASEEWNNNTPAPKHPNATIAADVRLNLFAGGSDKARLRAARAEVEARKLALQDLMQRIRNQVRAAWRGLEEARMRLEASRQVLAQSEESLRIRKLRAEQGLEKTSDVLDAQTRLDAARARAIHARYALTIAKARLLAAAGQLTPEVIQ